MSNVKLPAEQWDRILDFLRGCAGLYVAQEEDCQRFVEAVLWINRSGAQWRLLPAEYYKGIGTVSINDSPVGLTKASGNRCFNTSPATRTWNT